MTRTPFRTLGEPRLVLRFICLCALLLAAPLLAEEAPVNPGARRPANRLANETSPYLRLHAHNPVDWRPWDAAALAQAQADNKLIFLSVGYTSCHWCHVMERLVFNNQEIADYLNQHFISIKVDREERPDLDEVYMLSLQGYLQLSGQGGSGGWPMSLFLTPAGKPVAGGTYFPPDDMPGRPGFLTILKQLDNAWSTRSAEVTQSADVLAEYVRKIARPAGLPQPQLSAALVSSAAIAIAAQHDPKQGGFEFDAAAPNAPKFPVPSRIQLLQSQIGAEGAPSAAWAEMVNHTLDAMSRGGLRDHLGGGFHRYTIDRAWRVPHFEKMLTDNAQLIDVYLDAFRRTGRREYRQVAEEVMAFVQRELVSPQGAFCSALDAESDGIEGQYYLWTAAQLHELLPTQDATLFAAAYGTDQTPVLERGHVLSLVRPLSETARQLQVPQAELEVRLAEMRQKLLESRKSRPALLRDDKVLAGWNGLMIQALARSGSVLGRREQVQAAERAALFILGAHRDAEGELLRSSRNGQAHIPAYLDDYAYLTSGLLALHEATGEDKWLSAARRLMDSQIRLFWDDSEGGFFFTSRQHETLLVRTKDAFDSALPSPNGVSLRNLVRLARLTSDDRYQDLARRTASAFAGQLQSTPANLSTLAMGIKEHLHWFGAAPGRDAAQDLFADRPVAREDLLAQGPRPPAAADAALTAALKASTEEAAKHAQVSALAFLSTDRLQPGSRLRVAVEVKIARGWHANANPPQPDYMIPVKLTLKSAGKVELKEVAYPAGKNFRVAGIDEALSVYEGTVYLTGILEVPAGLSAAEDLTVEVDYQICNDKTCLRPAKLILTGKVPAGTGAQAANKALFDKLFPPRN